MDEDERTAQQRPGEDPELIALLFDERDRPTTPGTTTPTAEQLSRFHQKLDSISAAHQRAEAQSAALFVG